MYEISDLALHRLLKCILGIHFERKFKLTQHMTREIAAFM